jgi:uncharacterized protein (DUF58 family)
MIVPRTPLILITAILLLPPAVLATRSGIAAAVGWGLAAALVVMAAWDARAGRRRLRDLQLSAPPMIRMTVGRPAPIALTLQKPLTAMGRLRLALALPESVRAAEEEVRPPLSGVEILPVHWTCRALRRGRYVLQRCHAELISPWSLWGVRRWFDLDCEIRVYPNLVDGQRQLSGLFRRREWGLHSQRRMGKGREFEQLRDYLPGDNYDDIEWKATARRRHPVTKVFQVEQAQEIYVILDGSRLSTRSADYVMDRRQRPREGEQRPQQTIFERFITAALVMALATDRAADRFGLLLFGARPDLFIKAGRGRSHYNACRDALYHRMPAQVSPDFGEVFAFLGSHVRKRALLLFLTSLDDPLLSDSFVTTMQTAARRHIMLVNMFRPPGAYPLFSSSAVRQIDGIYQHLAGHVLWSALDETRRRLQQHGVGFQLLDKQRLSGQLVGRYLEIKQKQLL